LRIPRAAYGLKPIPAKAQPSLFHCLLKIKKLSWVKGFKVITREYNDCIILNIPKHNHLSPCFSSVASNLRTFAR
jgi:hypothetical protein